ncbi:MAG: VIT1/CCC1 transporter family protein [Rhodospirillaceae bacterium]
MLTTPGSRDAAASSRRALDPVDRVAEVLFGLIMVLSFTGSLSVAEAGRDDVRAMLIGALGCNLAWGIIDAILYLMGCLAERSRTLMTLKAVRTAGNPERARAILAEALPPAIAPIMEPDDLEVLRARLAKLPEPPTRAHMTREDWAGAAGVFLLVFLSTFPVVIPFIVMREAMPALRVSNAIAVAMLFMTGYTYGRLTGYRPVGMGISMVALGIVLVGITIALGG